VYSTGRTEKVRGITVEWLQKFRLPTPQRVYMRKDGDHREDNEVKAELLDQITSRYSRLVGYTIGGVFEDRQQVVDMYRARGLRVFQVAKGDF